MNFVKCAKQVYSDNSNDMDFDNEIRILAKNKNACVNIILSFDLRYTTDSYDKKRIYTYNLTHVHSFSYRTEIIIYYITCL